MAVYDSVQPSEIASFRDRSQDRSPDPTRARSGPFLATLAHIFAQDRQYHTVMATLTASENYVSLLVRAAAAFLGGEHYFFDPPTGGESGEWTFPARAPCSVCQKRFLQQMRLMFAADIADWRPNGGSVCEQAVLMAACRRGDAFVELLTTMAGTSVRGTGRRSRRREIHLPDARGPDRRRAYGRVDRAEPAHPAGAGPAVPLQATATDRAARCRASRKVTLAVDVSHTAGLIAGGVIPSPLTRERTSSRSTPTRRCQDRIREWSRSPIATIRWPRRCGSWCAPSSSRTAMRSAPRAGPGARRGSDVRTSLRRADHRKRTDARSSPPPEGRAGRRDGVRGHAESPGPSRDRLGRAGQRDR